MNQARRKAIVAACCAIAGHGCAANLTFNSPSPLGSGVLGKTWQTPYFVDSSLYIPGAQSISTTSPLVWDFAAASYGSSLELVGSWWDSSTTSTYRGYGRLYTDGVGWAGLGPNFGQVASDSTFSFSSVGLAAGPGGLFAATFFDGRGGAEPLDGASAYTSGTGWQPATNNSAANGTVLNHVPASTSTSNVASTMDSLGRGYFFFSDGTGLYQTPWATANPNGFSNTTLNASGGAVVPSTSPITARFDGSTQVCATYETAGAVLGASCQDIACGGPFNFSTTAASQQIASSVSGHDSATDGAGHIMVLFYKINSNSYNVYASIGTLSGNCSSTAPLPAEVWSTPVQIDAAVSGTGYNTSSAWTTLWPKGIRPGLAYVGSGRFLAVWVAATISSIPTLVASTSQVYYSLYDPATGGWQTASIVPGSSESYSVLPHPQALSVFGNGAGNAGFALNNIYTTDIIPAPTPASSVVSIYPESAQVRTIKLDRWHQDDGWVNNPPVSYAPLVSGTSAVTSGFTCFNLRVSPGSGIGAIQAGSPSNGGYASGGQSDCNHAPAGVILPSGNTVVFFTSQDGYNNGAIPGNRRLTAVEFR